MRPVKLEIMTHTRGCDKWRDGDGHRHFGPITNVLGLPPAASTA